MEDFFSDPKPVKAINWQLPTDKMGYGFEYSGDTTTIRGKRWMDTLVNMILEGPTKFLNRRKAMELYLDPSSEEYQKYYQWEQDTYGSQRFTKSDELINTLGTAHANFLPDIENNIFASEAVKNARKYGVTAGFLEGQSAGADHIDWMLGSGGAANFNHIFSQWGSESSDFFSVFEDMPLSGINKWQFNANEKIRNINQGALPVEVFAEFFGRINSVYGIAATGTADNPDGINANFADYGKLFSGARPFVEGKLNQAKQAGNYLYAPSFYELALSKENNPGSFYKTQQVAGGALVNINRGAGSTRTTLDDYDHLFQTPNEVFKLAMVMLESRRRFWQALTLMMDSSRMMERSLNKQVMQAAAQNPNLLAKVQGFQSYKDLQGQHAKKLEANMDQETIQWWESLKNNQVFKEAGEFNKMFLQFIYSFQHHMTNVLEPFFNSRAGRQLSSSEFWFDQDRNGNPDDLSGDDTIDGKDKFRISHYFAYPWDGDQMQWEIENIGIVNFNYYVVKKLKDYQDGANGYEQTIKNQYGGSYNSSIKNFYDYFDNPDGWSEEEYNNWKQNKLNAIRNLLDQLENDPNFINTMKVKAWRKELMRSGNGILNDKTKVEELMNDLDYAINFGGGLREFRMEFQLGDTVGDDNWVIDPFSGMDAKYGVNASLKGYQRQPESGDSFAWDMTQGFTVNIQNSDGDDYHSGHIFNAFQNTSTGSIKNRRTNEIIMKGMVNMESSARWHVGDLMTLSDPNTISPTGDGAGNANYRKFFGGEYRRLYDLIGTFRMKADFRDFDRKWQQYADFINNQNRFNKISYNAKYESWKERKENWEFDQLIAEKQRQKAIAESQNALYLIKMAGKKQQQENKKREVVLQKSTRKKEMRDDEFKKVYAVTKGRVENKKKEEKSKATAKKLGKGKALGQQNKTREMIRQQYLKSRTRKGNQR